MDTERCLNLKHPLNGINDLGPWTCGPEDLFGTVVIEGPESDEYAPICAMAGLQHFLSEPFYRANAQPGHDRFMSALNEHNTLSHFAINVEDCDRALAFYSRVFGWTFEAWGPPGFYMSRIGGLQAAIQKQQSEPFPTLIGNFECTIAVDDVDRVVALILEHGGAVTMPKVTIPSICDIARVKDSEGNTFSVARYLR